ncbi:MAG: AAA family ATPase [Dehalococcoidia bacterium]|nr:AAA family ATPase [Dehalococcoidia bacterium]
MVQHMKLKSFHVRLFRNIVDSGVILVDDVTCLVGKNEAGKSALLQALHHLNPAKPEVTLDLLDEYPRWLKKEHEITGEIEAAVPVRATFELSDGLMQKLSDQFGGGVLPSSRGDLLPNLQGIRAPSELSYLRTTLR